MKNRVREFRLEIGMPAAELARRAKTSRQTIHAIEKEQNRSISGELMFAIADVLKHNEREIFLPDHVTHGVRKDTG